MAGHQGAMKFGGLHWLILLHYWWILWGMCYYCMVRSYILLCEWVSDYVGIGCVIPHINCKVNMCWVFFVFQFFFDSVQYMQLCICLNFESVCSCVHGPDWSSIHEASVLSVSVMFSVPSNLFGINRPMDRLPLGCSTSSCGLNYSVVLFSYLEIKKLVKFWPSLMATTLFVDQNCLLIFCCYECFWRWNLWFL